MRRWYLYVAAALIAALLVGFSVRHFLEVRAQKRREVEYQKALRSYSQSLKTGVTRKQVEDYLSARKIPFQQVCCVKVKEFSRGVYDDAYDDLVQIGQEDAPWFCRQNNVYIALQFFGSYRNSPPRADASDKLKDVTIYHRFDGCL
jgi:hypothetical protein